MSPYTFGMAATEIPVPGGLPAQTVFGCGIDSGSGSGSFSAKGPSPPVCGLRWILFLSLSLAFSQATDNLSVGLSYRLRCRPLRLSSNVIIAAVNTAGTVLSMSAGGIISQSLSATMAARVGGTILLVLGLKEVATLLWSRVARSQVYMRPEVDAVSNAAVSNFKDNSMAEVYFLAIALTMTNLAGGLAGGLAHVPMLLLCPLSFIASVVMMVLGDSIAKLILGLCTTQEIDADTERKESTAMNCRGRNDENDARSTRSSWLMATLEFLGGGLLILMGAVTFVGSFS